MVDETTAAADEQVNDASQTDVAEPSESTEQTETTAETPEQQAEQPKPGTPDKALQKMQQELGNAVREIAALKDHRSADGLSEDQKSRLAKAEQRVQKIRGYVNRADRDESAADPFDSVAEQVVDLTEKASKQDRLEAELAKANERLEKLEYRHNWQTVKAKYAGLDTDSIWKKAWTDAEEILGAAATNDSLVNLASHTFRERCEAAKKRQGEPDPKKKTDQVPSSPSSYKVGTAPKTAPVLTEDQEVMRQALALVVEN